MPSKKSKLPPRTLLKRPFMIAAAFLLVGLAGLGVFIYRHNHQSSPATKTSKPVRPINSVDYSPGTSQDNSANDARKGSSSPATTLNNGPTATTSTSFTAQIVSANAANGNVHVGTLVTGTTIGTCNLIAEQSGQSTLSLISTTVRQDVNNYDCGPINISTSQFPTSGNWKLTLTITSNGQTSTDSKTINILP